MFFLSSSADHRDLHSFPTRRSSDLRLRLQNDRIDARLQKLRTFRCKRFLDRLVANARRIEFGDIKMVAKDRKSTRLNSSHVAISYAVFCLKKKKKQNIYYLSSFYTI